MGPTMGFPSADPVQEPNFPLKAVGAVARGAAARVTKSYLWFKAVTWVPLQGTAWKKAAVKTVRS